MSAELPLGGGRLRPHVIAVVMTLVFAAIAAKAGWQALFAGDPARPGVIAAISDPVERADIVDRNGELLASSITVYSLHADPRAIWDADETARQLATVFSDLDIEEVAERLSDRSRRFVYLRRGLTPRERQAVFALGLEGIAFEEERSRIYPRGTLAGHVLGFANLDGEGLAGVEFALDQRLAGGGEPVRLTIDSAVQFAVEDELSAAASEYVIQGGAGIVLDATTGEILALASWPPIDPNRYADLARDDPARMNRATQALYELGSVFKPLTIAAGFESGSLLPGDVFDIQAPLDVGGRPVRDTHRGPAQASVTDILVESSNKGTVLIALGIGERRLRDVYQRAGLLERADVQLPGSAAPLFPQSWTELDLSRISFGHGISVSPLAFAHAFSALANAGEVMPLTIVMRAEGEAAPTPRRVLSAPVAAAVTAMLRENVVRGTGKRAEVAGYRVAGKTGTAEKPVEGGYDTERNITSFAAIFPADDPKFVVLVVLDEPKPVAGATGETAALNAAPTVGRIIERIAPGLGVAPVFDRSGAEPVSGRGAGMGDRRTERETSL